MFWGSVASPGSTGPGQPLFFSWSNHPPLCLSLLLHPGGSPTTSFLTSSQTFWCLCSWTLPTWLALGVPGCQGSWGTTDNSVPIVETSPGTLTEVQVVGPTEADPAGWGTKEPPVILMWTSLPTATRLWAQMSFQCSLGRNWGWPEPRTMGNN